MNLWLWADQIEYHFDKMRLEIVVDSATFHNRVEKADIDSIRLPSSFAAKLSSGTTKNMKQQAMLTNSKGYYVFGK